ncbi:MAG TPA: hypothetical protein DEB31_01375 [Clostridiales bacterium]|nr:hypothetical protein [Clostridiales bacterium]
MNQSFAAPRTSGGLSANALKLIAILAMLVDHIAAGLLPAGEPLTLFMRFIGRITGPIMFYFIAEGYSHTRNVNSYTLRMALFALVSYIPYIYYFQKGLPGADNFYHFDVIFTLLLGLLAIRARNEIRNPVLKWCAIAVLLLLSTTSDWSYMGIICILLFDYFRGDFKKQAFAYSIATLIYILPSVLSPMRTLITGGGFDVLLLAQSSYRLGMFLPLALLYHYNGRIGKGGAFAKWGFYIFYPAHLVLLALIRQFIVS